jgi:peptidoglycan hydrolase CwlO-like protein
MKYVLAVIGMVAFTPFALANHLPDHEGDNQGKERHHVSPAETHMKQDAASMEAQMNRMWEQHDALHTKMDALQKKIDDAKGDVEKLSK